MFWRKYDIFLYFVRRTIEISYNGTKYWKQQKRAEKPKMWCGKKKRALCQGEKLVEI